MPTRSITCALLNPIDEAHDKAAEFTEAFTGRIVTTDWILMELADGLSGIKTRRALIEFIENHRIDPAVRIVPAGRSLLSRGWTKSGRSPIAFHLSSWRIAGSRMH